MDFYIIRLLRKSDGKERVTLRFSFREACDVVQHFFARHLGDYQQGFWVDLTEDQMYDRNQKNCGESFINFIVHNGFGEGTIEKKDHPRIIEVETLNDVLIEACLQKSEAYNKSRGAE